MKKKLKQFWTDNRDWLPEFLLVMLAVGALITLLMKFWYVLVVLAAVGVLLWLDRGNPRRTNEPITYTLEGYLQPAFVTVFDDLKARGISEYTGNGMLKLFQTAKLASPPFQNQDTYLAKFNLNPDEADKYLVYENKQLTAFGQQALRVFFEEKYAGRLAFQLAYLGCQHSDSGNVLTVSFSKHAKLIPPDDAFNRRDNDF